MTVSGTTLFYGGTISDISYITTSDYILIDGCVLDWDTYTTTQIEVSTIQNPG